MSLYTDNNNSEQKQQNLFTNTFSGIPSDLDPYIDNQPPTPPTPPDTLKLEYPALSSQIDQAISNGWNREQIRRYLGQRTELALTQYTPQEINKMTKIALLSLCRK